MTRPRAARRSTRQELRDIFAHKFRGVTFGTPPELDSAFDREQRARLERVAGKVIAAVYNWAPANTTQLVGLKARCRRSAKWRG